MKHSIEIQLPDVSLGEVQDFAKRFGCEAFKTKHRYYYRIETDDVQRQPERHIYLDGGL